MTQKIVDQIKQDCDDAAYHASRSDAVVRLLDAIGTAVSDWAEEEINLHNTGWFTVIMAASRAFSHLLVTIRRSMADHFHVPLVPLEQLKDVVGEHIELADQIDE